jgi:outer membrane protein TolC
MVGPDEAQVGLFPTLGLNAGVTRSAFGGIRGSSGITNAGGSIGGGGSGAFTQYTLEGSADWTPDLWGRIRREVQSEAAAAQISAADLANAALSAEATLAIDYFDLRATDALTTLLQQTVAAYRGALRITENQCNAGTISRVDVVTAQAQLQAVVAQLAGTGMQRAEFEHAIAVLTGRPPAALTVPPGWPSTLLERRPDIAAAERAMQEENALIGVAVAAYNPF